MDPLPFWHAGSQIVALNFQVRYQRFQVLSIGHANSCLNEQKYDRGVQLNSALFTDTPGWVLKPKAIRDIQSEDTSSERKTVKLKVEIKGASALALPSVRIAALQSTHKPAHETNTYLRTERKGHRCLLPSRAGTVPRS